MSRKIVITGLIIVSVAINLISVFSQSIRLDEAQSIWVATKSVPGLLYINAQDVQAPLYWLLLHFWMQILGTDIAIVRLLSLGFFLASIFVLYRLIRRASTEEVGLLAVALFGLSPFILWYSNEARTYTLFTFVVTLSHYYYLTLLNSQGRYGKLGYFIATLIGAYTHYFFAFQVAVQIIYFIYLFFKNRLTESGLSLWRSFRPQINFTLTYVILLLLVFIGFLPWLLYFYQQGLGSNTSPLLITPTSYTIIQLFVNLFFGFQKPSVQSIFISLWPISLVLIFFIFTRKIHFQLSHTGYFLLASTMPVILAFAISLIRPIFLSRYLILIAPTLFGLTAWLIINHTRRLFSPLIIALFAIAFSSLLYQNYSQSSPVKENYQQLVAYLTNNTTPQDLVAISAPFTIYPVEYYYNGQARLATIPEWNRYQSGAIPRFSDNDLTNQFDRYKTIYNRVFLVLSYDQGYEKSIRDYFDNHYQLLQAIDYPPQIKLRIYRLRYDQQPPPLNNPVPQEPPNNPLLQLPRLPFISPV